MGLHKKIIGHDADIMKKWINQNDNTIIEVDGKLFLIRPLQNSILEDIESDPELKKMIQQAKDDIERQDLFSGEEIRKAIE